MKIKRIPAIILAAAMLGTMPIVPPETGLSLSTVAYAAEKLNAPKDFTAAVNGTAAVLSWSAVKGADAYRIYQYDKSAKKFVNLKTVTSTKTSVKGLAEGKNYFKVAALTKSGSKYITGNISEKITVTVASAAESSAKTSGKNSAAVALAKKMGDGCNLGNTMESVATWLGAEATPKDYEKAWGQPETTAAMIKSLKASGFESVRVPVAWSNMMSKDGNTPSPPSISTESTRSWAISLTMICTASSTFTVTAAGGSTSAPPMKRSLRQPWTNTPPCGSRSQSITSPTPTN